MSTLTYEAFLPHHTASKHRVMAITHDVGQHTQLHAIATVSNALTVRRLADGLNSRLLDRRNHPPASTSHSPTCLTASEPQSPSYRSTPSRHIYTDPIDGILLFPTTACTPGQCPDCTDECRDCETCADYHCENCLPPDLTPRTAYALTMAGSLLADTCFDTIDDDTRMTPAERIQLLPSPWHYALKTTSSSGAWPAASTTSPKASKTAYYPNHETSPNN